MLVGEGNRKTHPESQSNGQSAHAKVIEPLQQGLLDRLHNPGLFSHRGDLPRALLGIRGWLGNLLAVSEVPQFAILGNRVAEEMLGSDGNLALIKPLPPQVEKGAHLDSRIMAIQQASQLALQFNSTRISAAGFPPVDLDFPGSQATHPVLLWYGTAGL